MVLPSLKFLKTLPRLRPNMLSIFREIMNLDPTFPLKSPDITNVGCYHLWDNACKFCGGRNFKSMAMNFLVIVESILYKCFLGCVLTFCAKGLHYDSWKACEACGDMIFEIHCQRTFVSIKFCIGILWEWNIRWMKLVDP